MDHYNDVHFIVLHALNQTSLEVDEVNMFIGSNFLVTYHHESHPEIDDAWLKVSSDVKFWQKAACTPLILR